MRDSFSDHISFLKFSSYLLKWAIHDKLANTAVNSIEELGPAIRQALTHHSIKGKFDGVSPLLKEHGYSRVIVTNTGLKFISAKDGKAMSRAISTLITLLFR